MAGRIRFTKQTVAVVENNYGGAPDIVVGEIGVANEQRGYQGRVPRIAVFENDGHAGLARHVVECPRVLQP